MDEIQKNIDEAFRLISTIPVSHDAVDVMAMARHYLRNASSGLANLRKNETAVADERADTEGGE